LALGVVNSWLLMVVLPSDEPDTLQPQARAALQPDVTQALNDITEVKPFRAYTETLAHPIFYKNRSPYVAPPPAPPAVAPKPPTPSAPADPGIAVGGVILDGALKKAYLFGKGGAQGSWVAEGESFMGWMVRSIDGAGAKLGQADRTIELQLYGKR
jgi:hypothetical protein